MEINTNSSDQILQRAKYDNIVKYLNNLQPGYRNGSIESDAIIAETDTPMKHNIWYPNIKETNNKKLNNENIAADVISPDFVESNWEEQSPSTNYENKGLFKLLVSDKQDMEMPCDDQVIKSTSNIYSLVDDDKAYEASKDNSSSSHKY